MINIILLPDTPDKKKKDPLPEIHIPRTIPEWDPLTDPEEPLPPDENPDTIPEEDPFETPPYEVPPPGEAP